MDKHMDSVDEILCDSSVIRQDKSTENAFAQNTQDAVAHHKLG